MLPLPSKILLLFLTLFNLDVIEDEDFIPTLNGMVVVGFNVRVEVD